MMSKRKPILSSPEPERRESLEWIAAAENVPLDRCGRLTSSEKGQAILHRSTAVDVRRRNSGELLTTPAPSGHAALSLLEGGDEPYKLRQEKYNIQ